MISYDDLILYCHDSPMAAADDIRKLKTEVARLREDVTEIPTVIRRYKARAETAEAEVARLKAAFTDLGLYVRLEAAESKLRAVEGLKPLHKGEVEQALAADDTLTFISYDELRVKLDELEAELKKNPGTEPG